MDIISQTENALLVLVRCHHLTEKQRLNCQVRTPDSQIWVFSCRLGMSALPSVGEFVNINLE